MIADPGPNVGYLPTLSDVLWLYPFMFCIFLVALRCIFWQGEGSDFAQIEAFELSVLVRKTQEFFW